MKEITKQIIELGYVFIIKLQWDSDREHLTVVCSVSNGFDKTRRTSPIICTIEKYEIAAVEGLRQCLTEIQKIK